MLTRHKGGGLGEGVGTIQVHGAGGFGTIQVHGAGGFGATDAHGAGGGGGCATNAHWGSFGANVLLRCMGLGGLAHRYGGL